MGLDCESERPASGVISTSKDGAIACPSTFVASGFGTMESATPQARFFSRYASIARARQGRRKGPGARCGDQESMDDKLQLRLSGPRDISHGKSGIAVARAIGMRSNIPTLSSGTVYCGDCAPFDTMRTQLEVPA
jgi:hypothetical protein